MSLKNFMASKTQKILIATPLYPPQLGGPAYYAKHLSESLRNFGVSVIITNFGDFLHLPTGIRHIAYFFKLLSATKNADVAKAMGSFVKKV